MSTTEIGKGKPKHKSPVRVSFKAKRDVRLGHFAAAIVEAEREITRLNKVIEIAKARQAKFDALMAERFCAACAKAKPAEPAPVTPTV